MTHFTVAASEAVFRELFNVLRDNFTFSRSDNGNFGPFSASYDLEISLENGQVDLENGNIISIKELDIKWDRLELTLSFNIPEMCVGGFCIIPTPFGCALRAPRICVFSANPDITVTLPLSNLITSEISVSANPVAVHRVDPGRTSAMSNLDAEDAGIPNKWQIFLIPRTIDIDPIDIADTVGDLLENAVDAVIDGLLGWLPGWARDIIRGILGPIIDLIRAILDIPDDISEWISNLLGVSFGVLNLIVTAISTFLATQFPIQEFEDPFPILPASGILIPVKIPIEKFAVVVNDAEMKIEIDVGV